MSWLTVVSSRSEDPAHLIRAEVGRLWGLDHASVRLTHLCPSCGSGSHGALSVLPWSSQVTPPWVSLSRSGGFAVVAVASQGPVGIDVEHIDSFSDPTLSGVVLHPQEQADDRVALATSWVRKEALLKAAGCGLTVDPRLIRLSSATAPPALLHWPSEVWAVEPTWVRDIEITTDVRAAIAGLGRAPQEVTIRTAEQAEPHDSAKRRTAR